MGLGFKSKRETRYEHKDDCQILLTYAKDRRKTRKTRWGTTDSQQRPGSLPLYFRKPKTTVLLQEKESAPLLQCLNSATEDSAHKRVERAKDQASSSRMPPARSSLASVESNVVVVGHQLTQDGLE